VYLKVYPLKHVLWFGRKGKLALRCIGPYKVIGPVTYKLALPSHLAKINDVFHVFFYYKKLM
jgi:hypothetical protein